MTVTQIQSVTKTKYKVYLDEQFAFVLYKGELSLYGIQEGMELSQSVVDRIKKEVLEILKEIDSKYIEKVVDYFTISDGRHVEITPYYNQGTLDNQKRSIKELKEIREKMQDQIAFRAEHEGEFPILDGFRKHVLVCGGTGCTSSGSTVLFDEFEKQLKIAGIENEIKMVRSTFIYSFCNSINCAYFYCM